jgi:hypothetical protein
MRAAALTNERGPRAAAKASIWKTAPARAVRNSRCNVGIFISEGDRKVAGSMLAAECLPNFSDHF